MAIKMVRLKCQNCGSSLDLDMDNLMAYCPYCGQKLLFDVDQIGNILLEKEKTKQKVIDRDIETKRIENEQKKIDNEAKRNEDKSEIKWFILCFGFIALVIAISMIGSMGLK